LIVHETAIRGKGCALEGNLHGDYRCTGKPRRPEKTLASFAPGGKYARVFGVSVEKELSRPVIIGRLQVFLMGAYRPALIGETIGCLPPLLRGPEPLAVPAFIISFPDAVCGLEAFTDIGGPAAVAAIALKVWKEYCVSLKIRSMASPLAEANINAARANAKKTRRSPPCLIITLPVVLSLLSIMPRWRTGGKGTMTFALRH
jgi:hypothetical protein